MRAVQSTRHGTVLRSHINGTGDPSRGFSPAYTGSMTHVQHSQDEIHILLRRLAGWTAPEGTGVLSVLLDSRSEASGERPGERTASITLKDRLNEIEKSLLPRGPGLQSFRIDRIRVEQAFTDASPAAAGIAIFACSAADLFEVVEAGAPFENRVVYDDYPAIYQLARLADEYEPAVVALADSNTLRVFVLRQGTIEETTGKDEESIHFRKRRTGGMSQERFQRHIQKHREDFAAEAAEAISGIVEEEGARRLVLAGDEVAIPLLRNALPARVHELVVGDALRIHIRAPRNEVEEEVAALLELAEAADSREVADAFVAEIRKDGLAIAGADPTRRALEAGQADVLVILDHYEPFDTRNELSRLAVATGASIEVVPSHPGLEALGGVGAILRYRA